MKQYENELIDTLWNVNRARRGVVMPAVRINRYIMECKSEACS